MEAGAGEEAPPAPPGYDLFVFGSNPFGALGLGEDETVKYRPAQVEVAGAQFSQVACGGMHTVALTPGGLLYSWGVNDEGALGRPTSGTCWEGTPEEQLGDPALPGIAEAPEGARFVQVVAGDGFTFALTATGAIYGCGQFKDDVSSMSGFTPGTKLQRTLAPVLTPDSAGQRVKVLAAGAKHCLALTQEGAVLSWGIGSQGQLGRVGQFNAEDPKSAEELFVPQRVPLDKRSAVKAVATGSYSSFAITHTGSVLAWGLNNSGQLGLSKANDDDNLHWAPVKVPALAKVEAIQGGQQHTLILTSEGKLMSCGAATYGMLGRADVDVAASNSQHPQPAAVHGLDGVKLAGLAAGDNVSACVSAEGQLWLWGTNTNHQLAKGDTDEDAVVPEQFKRTKAFGWRPVKSVCFGGLHGALLAGAPDPTLVPSAANKPSAPVPAEPTKPAEPVVPAEQADKAEAMDAEDGAGGADEGEAGDGALEVEAGDGAEGGGEHDADDGEDEEKGGSDEAEAA